MYAAAVSVWSSTSAWAVEYTQWSRRRSVGGTIWGVGESTLTAYDVEVVPGWNKLTCFLCVASEPRIYDVTRQQHQHPWLIPGAYLLSLPLRLPFFLSCRPLDPLIHSAGFSQSHDHPKYSMSLSPPIPHISDTNRFHRNPFLLPQSNPRQNCLRSACFECRGAQGQTKTRHRAGKTAPWDESTPIFRFLLAFPRILAFRFSNDGRLYADGVCMRSLGRRQENANRTTAFPKRVESGHGDRSLLLAAARSTPSWHTLSTSCAGSPSDGNPGHRSRTNLCPARLCTDFAQTPRLDTRIVHRRKFERCC